MDALIMAAGRGSRLGAITANLPKALLDLGGVTPLQVQLETLASRDVERVVIATGYAADRVRAAAESYARGRLEMVYVYNPFWSVTNVLGSAWFARKHLADDFVYLHADTVFDPTILDDVLNASGEVCLPIDAHPCGDEEMKAEVVGRQVVYLSKNLPAARTAGEFIGVAAFRARAVAAIRRAIEQEIDAGAIAEYFEAAINRIVREAHVAAIPVDVRGRRWTEIDFPDDLAAARQHLYQFLPRGFPLPHRP